jgi:hypothetical protein
MREIPTPTSIRPTGISVEAAAAFEQLRLLPGNWRIADFGGHWRVQRINGDSYFLGHISADKWSAFNRCAIAGLAFVKSMLADEAARLLLPRYVFGASPSSSAK